MDDVAANIIDRETALADFDHARDDFENAMSKVPDEALDFKPEGDDYTVGDLIPHCAAIATMYSDVLDEMKRANFGEVKTAHDYSEQALLASKEKAAALIKVKGPRAGLEYMEAAHDRLAYQLRAMTTEEYAMRAPVYYGPTDEPYPTRASDILGWVTDHYREHVPHVAELLEKWKTTRDA